MRVGEHELDEAERILLARRLAQGDLSAAAHHLVAAPGLAAIGGDLGQHRLQDRGRHVPGWVDDGVFHRPREDRRRRFRLADDDAGLIPQGAPAEHAQPVLGHVHEHVVGPELGRQPAPALHVDDERRLVAGRRLAAPVGSRQCQHGLGVEDARGREAPRALEALHRVGHRRVVGIRLARARIQRAGAARLEPEMRAQQRHARVAHAEPQHRPRRQPEGRFGRPLRRPAGLGRRPPQAREARLEGAVARRMRVVGLQLLARRRARAGDARQNHVGGGQVEARGDQARDRGEVDPAAARVAGVEGDRGRELEVGLRHGGEESSLRGGIVGLRRSRQGRHGIGPGIEPVLPRRREPRRRGLGRSRIGAVRDPDRLEGAERVEGADRLALLARQPREQRGGVREAPVERGGLRIARLDGGRRRIGGGGRLRRGGARIRRHADRLVRRRRLRPVLGAVLHPIPGRILRGRILGRILHGLGRAGRIARDARVGADRRHAQGRGLEGARRHRAGEKRGQCDQGCARYAHHRDSRRQRPREPLRLLYHNEIKRCRMPPHAAGRCGRPLRQGQAAASSALPSSSRPRSLSLR
ncbi:hypothetical protein MET9862_01994 [Methylobacterium symbioticum]|uniref:Uncharacterized protein n=1 Tax=Methylobacterium symbioticum TaxID=2584084 RepID=A0A509EB81_9HYPH|nr:hypothetical protein MET9862_01994 [Methylobacterium symbioticum]